MARESIFHRAWQQGTGSDRYRSIRWHIVAVSVLISMLICLGTRPASSQITDNLEFGGGYVHMSGDNGLNGLNLSTALWMNHRVTLSFDYDSGWNSSRLGVFDFTSVGATAIHSHLQNFLIGPRIFFRTQHIKKYKLVPMAELEFGGSVLSQNVQSVNGPSASGSAHSFTWMLGGGADYEFNRHWSGRVKLDLLRTHMLSAGQSRFRIGLGVAYTLAGKNTRY
jgi:hypothetical protein